MVSVAGILNSLRKARKRSTSEILEELDASIELIEEHKNSSISSASKVAFRLIFYASVIYASGLILAYLKPCAPFGKVVIVGLAIAYPLLVWLLKYVINLYYLGSAERADRKLKSLNKQKKEMLLKVMDTETYNKAQQILKRFDPYCQFQVEHMNVDFMRQNKADDANIVRNRRLPSVPTTQSNRTPYQRTGNLLLSSDQNQSVAKPAPSSTFAPECPAVPVRHRPILPRERSILDKLIDALVGDGPDRRYALICQRCAAHNGMALAEEFEFLAFRCCYCEFLNPAHRVRRNSRVPRLDTFPNPEVESESTPLSLKSGRVYSSSVSNLFTTGIRSNTTEEPRRTLQSVMETSHTPSEQVLEETLAPSLSQIGQGDDDKNASFSSDNSAFEE